MPGGACSTVAVAACVHVHVSRVCVHIHVHVHPDVHGHVPRLARRPLACLGVTCQTCRAGPGPPSVHASVKRPRVQPPIRVEHTVANHVCKVVDVSEAIARVAATHMHRIDLADDLRSEELCWHQEGVDVGPELLDGRPTDDHRAMRNEWPRATPQDGQGGGREAEARADLAVTVHRLQGSGTRMLGVPAAHIGLEGDEA